MTAQLPRAAVRALVWVLPAAAAFSLGWWQVSARSFSAVEAATLDAARRPLPGLLWMLSHVDAVHGVYYLLIHEVLLVSGSEAAVRLPSVVATALTAGVLARLGTRLAGARLGLAAGMLYAVLPPTTLAAQTARPFALATGAAVVACYRLLVYLEEGGRGNAALYTAALALTGLLDVMAMLVVVANVATVAVVPQWRAARGRGFAWAAGMAVALVAPLAVLALTQVGQTGWEKPLSGAELAGLSCLLLVCALVAFLIVWPGAIRRTRTPPGAAGAAEQQAPERLRRVAAVAAPWLLLPPALILAVSVFSPFWQDRYLLFCLPALCLVCVAVLTRLPPAGSGLALTVAVGAVLAAQPVVRGEIRTDDLESVARTIAAYARPGDAVIFHNPGGRLIEAAYPAGFRHLRDITLNPQSPSRHQWFGLEPDALYGQDVSTREVDQRLSAVSRLWVIRLKQHNPPTGMGGQMGAPGFCAQRTWQLRSETLTLYRRCHR